MKKIRILSLILALLTVVSLLTACKKEEEGPAPTSTENVTLNLVDRGVAKYVIVYDYAAGYEVRNAVKTLVEGLKANHNADIAVKECFLDREDPADVPEANEILIGMTNREESRAAFQNLRSNDWVMEARGTRLVLGSSSDAGTVMALFNFMNDYVYEQGDRNLVREYNRGNASGAVLPSLSFTSADNKVSQGTYSYSKAIMADARMDSYVLIYPKRGEFSDQGKAIADDLRSYISRETGYELDVYKDTRLWGDYEILIGDTIRTDDGLYRTVGDNEYLIKLVKRTVTYEDGSAHEGAQLFIIFGKNAADAALAAFKKKVMPSSQTPIELILPDGFTVEGTV